MSRESILTCGEYAVEQDATQAILSIINKDHWDVQQKASGFMLHPRVEVTGSGHLELDILLSPKRLLMEHGWRWGHVGIECKRSGKKVGPVIAQAMDYTRAAWNTPSGFLVMTRLVFVWPCDPPQNELASLMANHRVGTAKASGSNQESLMLWFNGRIAYADKGGDPPLIAADLPGGCKQGSR
jgi:hypothetical protein